MSTQPSEKSWVLLRSIYQRPSPQSHGHYVVLSSPKPLAITASHATAVAELSRLKDAIMRSENTEGYSVILPVWTWKIDTHGVDIKITPKEGKLRIEVRLRIEEVDLVGAMQGLGTKEVDVVDEIREMAALGGKQDDSSEGRYWVGPMEGYEGIQHGRSGHQTQHQTPHPDKDPDEKHYDFASTRLRFHPGGEEEDPSLFTPGIADINIPVLPKWFAGSSIDGRVWTVKRKEED